MPRRPPIEHWRNSIVRYADEPPDSLLANPRNWRIHAKSQQDALAGVLGDIGWIAPVVVNETTQHVIDGHLRVSMAISRGEPTVPVAYVRLTEQEEVEALATFDPLAGLAVADTEQLDALLREVSTDSDAVRAMLADLAKQNGLILNGQRPAGDPGPQIDRAEELRETWQTERGQVWLIPSMTSPGREHRLMCGDSTVEADVSRLLASASPTLTVTDPPYGVDYDPNWRQEAAEKGQLAYAPRRIGKVPNDQTIDWSDAFRPYPGDVIYCWHPSWHVSTVQLSLENAGYEIRCLIIWVKPHFSISRGHYHWRHEPCWYAVRKGRQAHWIGDRKQTTVWEIALDHNIEGGHSTQKPVECMAIPIRNHAGDVYDPFVGSGTTLVAAEQLARVCYGMEIDPGYTAVCLQRLSGMGLEPRREESV